MGDFFGVVLTVLLLAANAFFVGAEFALISARRDRLEALAEQGKHSAVTVIRAGENLPVMLAGAQLGITICSILLGRVGEPAVAHLLEKPFHLIGIPDTVLHTVSFVIAITAFGFVLAAPVMLFVYLRFRSRESWWLCLLLSLGVLGLLYGVFQTALGVPLFEGLATLRIKDWLTSAGSGSG